MSKFVVYQLFTRLFANETTNKTINGSIHENGCGKFNNITTNALLSIKDLGATHIWYTGIIEHATQTDYSNYGISNNHPAVVKGKAGSPYAIKDYYDVCPDLAEDVAHRMEEFEKLISRTHQAGLKAIIDFVPNHVAREYKSDCRPKGIADLGENDCCEWHFSPLNNFYYIPGYAFKAHFDISDYHEFPAKATGNDRFTASPDKNDWYETIKLNYGVNYTEGNQKQFDPIPDTWIKMRDILLYWTSKGVDGFRCDMAEMVPVEFWGWVIPQIKEQNNKLIFIAEVYNPDEYRNYIFNGKFDYLYDKVGLYDTLRDIVCHRQPASAITRCWQSLEGIQDRMLNFLENHDEQRIASDFFAGDPRKAYAAMIATATISTAPVMIYSGQELGEAGMDEEGYSGRDGRTTIFDYWSLKCLQDWSNHGNYNTEGLDIGQLSIRNFYKQVLNTCVGYKAINQGEMYDLQYANFNTPGYNPDIHFAFCRKKDNELILVVLNFGEECSHVTINFPVDFFEHWNIARENCYSVVDILTNQTVIPQFQFGDDRTISVTTERYHGRILRFLADK